jgi:hypothetical protein
MVRGGGPAWGSPAAMPIGAMRPVPLPQTDRVLAGLIDMRLPLTFHPDDVALIARIIAEEVPRAAGRSLPAGSP